MAYAIDDEATRRQEVDLAHAEALIDQLHDEVERHRTMLARQIHDELCSLLVSAAMDVILVQKRGLRNSAAAPPLAQGLIAIQAAVQLSRRMVEELRPSILDNFGLFAALKWHSKQVSEGSEVQLTTLFPTDEPALSPNAVTTLFRLGEQAINLMFRREGVMAVGIHLELRPETIKMTFSADGEPERVDGKAVDVAGPLRAMQHRIRPMGGTVMMIPTAQGARLEAQIPLEPPKVGTH